MRIGIVGVGLLGGSLAAALKNTWGNEVELTAISSERTLAKARKLPIFSNVYTYEAITEAAQQLDVLYLCTPILTILDHIKLLSHTPALSSTLVISDVGSTKQVIMQAAEEALGHRSDMVFIGGHPMAGSEFKGIDAIEPSLYENAIYVLTPPANAHDEHVNRLLNIVKAVGAIPIVMEPSRHDRVAAGISHLPQMMATGLVDYISKDDNVALSKTMAAGGFRDMTRIASSQYKMWADIVATNKLNILDMIDGYINQLNLMKEAIENNSLEPMFDNAARTRDSIPKGTKGMMQSYYDIRISVQDKPGTILRVSTILAEENINIKDISVIKSREREGGHFLLSFATEQDCITAEKLLQFHGYYARKVE